MTSYFIEWIDEDEQECMAIHSNFFKTADALKKLRKSGLSASAYRQILICIDEEIDECDKSE